MTQVFLTGATGFLGEHVAHHLVKASYNVSVLVRGSSQTDTLEKDGIRLYRGDLDFPASMIDGLRGADIFINLASLGFGHAPSIIQAVEEAGIQRALFISTTSVFTRVGATSKVIRVAAERCIYESDLDYTVIRPTMIYGTPRDRNIWRLIKYLDRWPLIPIVGSGRALQQPVFVDDLAQAVVQAIEAKSAIRQEYNIAGLDALAFSDMVDTVCRVLNRRVQKIHTPIEFGLIGANILNRLGIKLEPEQIRRLNEDKGQDLEKAATELCYTPLSFEQGILRETRFLRGAI